MLQDVYGKRLRECDITLGPRRLDCDDVLDVRDLLLETLAQKIVEHGFITTSNKYCHIGRATRFDWYLDLMEKGHGVQPEALLEGDSKRYWQLWQWYEFCARGNPGSETHVVHPRLFAKIKAIYRDNFQKRITPWNGRLTEDIVKALS